MFQDVKLTWKGEEKVIKSSRILKAIAIIESTFPMTRLARYAETKDIPMAQLAQAYGALLRFAGFSVEDDDIYAGMFAKGETAVVASSAINTLLAIMVPPSALAKAEKDGEPGNDNRAQRKARASLKNTTRP